MSDGNGKDQAYKDLVEQGLSSEAIEIRDNGNELRRDPRFEVEDGSLAVRVEPNFDIVDLSVSGMAFLSDIPFTPGSNITMYPENTMGIDAMIVGCFMVETDSGLMETRYRVQCRFENEEQGKQVLLMMGDSEKLKI